MLNAMQLITQRRWRKCTRVALSRSGQHFENMETRCKGIVREFSVLPLHSSHCYWHVGSSQFSRRRGETSLVPNCLWQRFRSKLSSYVHRTISSERGQRARHVWIEILYLDRGHPVREWTPAWMGNSSSEDTRKVVHLHLVVFQWRLITDDFPFRKDSPGLQSIELQQTFTSERWTWKCFLLCNKRSTEIMIWWSMGNVLHSHLFLINPRSPFRQITESGMWVFEAMLSTPV